MREHGEYMKGQGEYMRLPGEYMRIQGDIKLQLKILNVLTNY